MRPTLIAAGNDATADTSSWRQEMIAVAQAVLDRSSGEIFRMRFCRCLHLCEVDPLMQRDIALGVLDADGKFWTYSEACADGDPPPPMRLDS